MIELLGVGVVDHGGGWRVRRVSVALERASVVALVSAEVRERDAVADAIAARVVPREGRLWLHGVPLIADTVRRLRARVSDVAPSAPLADDRSVLWNVTLDGGARSLLCLIGARRPVDRGTAMSALAALCLGRRALATAASLSRADRLRVHVARALAREQSCIVLRDAVAGLVEADVDALLRALRAAARTRRITAIVTHHDAGPLEGRVDRILQFRDGTLVDDRAGEPHRAAAPAAAL